MKCLISIAVLCLLMGMSGEAQADNMMRADIIQAVIGEAEGEGSHGMGAVAYAILNRGTLKGVYGYKAITKRKDGYYRGKRRITDGTVFKAECAVDFAISHEDLDITEGATHWEGTVFKEPYWAKSMVKTVVIGRQAFYRVR